MIKVTVSKSIASQFEQLAEITQRSESSLVHEALSRYLDSEAWQVLEIRQALNEANAGDFASASEVSALFSRLRKSTS